MEGRTSRSVIYILKVYCTCSLSCNFWQQDIPSTGFEITFEEYLSSSNVEKKNEVYAFPTSVSLMCFFLLSVVIKNDTFYDNPLPAVSGGND